MSNAFRIVADNPYVSADYQQIKKVFAIVAAIFIHKDKENL